MARECQSICWCEILGWWSGLSISVQGSYSSGCLAHVRRHMQTKVRPACNLWTHTTRPHTPDHIPKMVLVGASEQELGSDHRRKSTILSDQSAHSLTRPLPNWVYGLLKSNGDQRNIYACPHFIPPFFPPSLPPHLSCSRLPPFLPSSFFLPRYNRPIVKYAFPRC